MSELGCTGELLKVLRGKRCSQRRVSEGSTDEEEEEGPGQRQRAWKRERVCASNRGKGTTGAPQRHGTQGWEPMGDRRLTLSPRRGGQVQPGRTWGLS